MKSKKKLFLVYSMQFPLLTLSMELPDDSFLDVLILHQLDFILHVVGVSFSFDNIFLHEVENIIHLDCSFLVNFLVKSKTSHFALPNFPFGLFLFLVSIFHFRVLADPSFNYSGAIQLNVSLIPFV